MVVTAIPVVAATATQMATQMEVATVLLQMATEVEVEVAVATEVAMVEVQEVQEVTRCLTLELASRHKNGVRYA